MLGLAVLAQVGFSVTEQGIPALTGFIKNDLGVSAGVAGLIVACFPFGRVVGSYVAGVAADRLGESFTYDWLKSNLASLPHGKTGKGRGRAGRVFFTEAHLAEIVEKYTVRSDVEPEPAQHEFASIVSRRGGAA